MVEAFLVDLIEKGVFFEFLVVRTMPLPDLAASMPTALALTTPEYYKRKRCSRYHVGVSLSVSMSMRWR